jgi:hypothetical protein
MSALDRMARVSSPPPEAERFSAEVRAADRLAILEGELPERLRDLRIAWREHQRLPEEAQGLVDLTLLHCRPSLLETRMGLGRSMNGSDAPEERRVGSRCHAHRLGRRGPEYRTRGGRPPERQLVDERSPLPGVARLPERQGEDPLLEEPEKGPQGSLVSEAGVSEDVLDRDAVSRSREERYLVRFQVDDGSGCRQKVERRIERDSLRGAIHAGGEAGTGCDEPREKVTRILTPRHPPGHEGDADPPSLEPGHERTGIERIVEILAAEQDPQTRPGGEHPGRAHEATAGSEVLDLGLPGGPLLRYLGGEAQRDARRASRIF